MRKCQENERQGRKTGNQGQKSERREKSMKVSERERETR